MKNMSAPLLCAITLLSPLALYGCGSAPLTTKVLDQSAFAKSTSIAVMDFSAKDTSLHYGGNADSLGHIMAGYLHNELGSRARGLLVYLGDSGVTPVDLVVDGEFTAINTGVEEERVFLGPLGSGGVTVAVKGVIRRPSGDIVAEFSKSKTSQGGPIGMGGILAGDSDTIVDDIMSEIAEDLAEFIVENIAAKERRW